MPPDVAVAELTRSRIRLEQLTGKPVTVFSYPFSNQNRAVRALARQAGYRACVRGKGRMNFRWTNPWALRRIKLDYTMGIDDLRRTLWRARYLQLD